MLRTIFAGAVLSVMTILLAPVAVAAHVLRIDQKRGRVQQWCMATWARSVAWAGGVTIKVHGAENIVASRGTVYVSNHVSWFDIFTTASTLPRFTFVAKDELRRIPIFGWGAEGAGVVFLARENRKSAFDAYALVAEKVSHGASVIVYPEGTRGKDNRLRSFKKGPFVLAIAAKAPVVPLVVYGTCDVMSRDAWRVKAGTVHLHFLDPIPTKDYDYEHRHELMQRVWNEMAGVLHDQYAVSSHGFRAESSN